MRLYSLLVWPTCRPTQFVIIFYVHDLQPPPPLTHFGINRDISLRYHYLYKNIFLHLFFLNSRETILYLINITIVEIRKSAHSWD